MKIRIFYWMTKIVVVAMWVLSSYCISVLYKRGELLGGLTSWIVGQLAILVSLFLIIWFLNEMTKKFEMEQKEMRNAKASKKF
jgi:uncharacterized membrane protein YjjP (DUF1212 family)